MRSLTTFDHENIDLGKQRNKYSLFPIEEPDLWRWYKKQSQAFWLPEEIDFSKDLADFETRLAPNEQFFVKHILAFFNQSDGIVNENLCFRFYRDIVLPEARAFYAMQIAIEAIHSETYSLLLETLVRDPDEKSKLFNAIETIPAVKEKARWAFSWIDSSEDFAERLFAFAIVEGIFFSGSFCAIYWLKKRNLLPGLCKANEFISRDEGIHWMFACALFKNLGLRLSKEKVRAIIQDAVAIEKRFICEALPVDLIGMNKNLMGEYIEYTADRVLQNFGFGKIFSAANPFDFMVLLDLESKTNFFEGRVSEYKRGATKSLSFDADF